MCINTHYGCFSCCGAAAPWRCGDIHHTTEETVDVEIGRVEAGSELPTPSDVLFASLKPQVHALKFFPTDKSRWHQLIYLAHLSEHQSPYSLSEKIIFERSFRSDLQTKRWLNFALWGGVVILPTLSILAGTDKAKKLFNDEDGTSVALPMTLALTIVIGAIAWIATGSNPDFKSDSANDRQDKLNAMPENFLQIARELILLNYSQPALAHVIATHLKVDFIRRKMLKDDPKARIAPDLIALETAIAFVLGQALPERMPVALDALIRTMGPVTRERVSSESFPVVVDTAIRVESPIGTLTAAPSMTRMDARTPDATD